MRTNYRTFSSAQFQMLSEDQLQEIVSSVFRVMEHTGFEVHNEKACQTLAAAGAWVDGTRVRIPSWVVRRALSTAPSTFTIYARKGHDDHDLHMAPNHVNFGPSGSNLYYLDPRDGQSRKLVRSDVSNVAAVCNALPNITYVSSYGTLSDVPPMLASVYEFAELISSASKPPMAWAHDLDGCREIHEMALAVVGGQDAFVRKPNYFFFACPTSPLVLPDVVAAQLMFCASHRIPFVNGPCPMAGATTPCTLAGTLVVDMADSLLGLVIAQNLNPGTAFWIGGTNTAMDMRTGIMAYGAPELSVLGAAEAELGRFLGVPVWTTAGASDSKLLDEQAVLEGSMSILCAVLSGHSLVHNVGYIESTRTGSLQQLVLMDEVIGFSKHILRGIEVNAETLAIDVIDQVGPGGDFISTAHTLRHHKTELWNPHLIDRERREAWEASGSKTLGQRAWERLQEILDGERIEPLPPDVTATIESVLSRAQARVASRA